jgi:hypothetical protein
MSPGMKISRKAGYIDDISCPVRDQQKWGWGVIIVEDPGPGLKWTMQEYLKKSRNQG